MKEILVEEHSWPSICLIGNSALAERLKVLLGLLCQCVGSSAACGNNGEQTGVYLYCFIIYVFFYLLAFAKELAWSCVPGLVNAASVCYAVCPLGDRLSTCPNFSAALQAVLVLKNTQAQDRRRVELKSLIIWNNFNTLWFMPACC